MTQMSIVIPAYFVSAGIVFYTGLQAAVVGFVGHRVPLYLAFAFTCFCAAGFQLASTGYYLADSVAAASVALHWQVVFVLLFLPAFFVFIALYTGQRRIIPWLLLLTAFSGTLIVGNLLSPYSLRFDTLEAVAPLVLPWGETLAQFSGTPGAGNMLLRAYAWTVLGWAIWRTTVQFRRGERRAALFLAACLLLIIGASIWGLLIDLDVIRSFYIVAFAFLGLALLMSICLGLDLRDRNSILETANAILHTEIGKRREAETRVRQMAYKDYLTGLANRLLLHEHLEGAIEQARRTGRYGAMLLIDLDHFKTINDALSHEVGDQVLREVARRLTEAAAGEAFVARLGGDEFVAVVAPMSVDSRETAATAHRLAETVARQLSESLTVGERVLHVGASIGIAPFPTTKGSTALDILRHADMALFRAKNLGRNNIQFYEPDMQAAADERLKLDRGLRAALENEEFTLHFQPQFNAAGQPFGAEALLRWQHPQTGMIPPLSFIPVAEETGLIHAIGGWVFDRACERLMQWRRTGEPFRGDLSINVSPWQFARPDFVSQVEYMLSRHGIGPGDLTLEMTETALLFDLAETIKKLQALRAMGLKIALDDFGTGYSSLAYLRSLPLDRLKIGMSFVQELTGETGNPLVEDMIAIGRHVGLKVIAEGVESPMQRDLLLKMGCEQFQGNLFCRPLAEPEFLRWLADHRAKMSV